MPKFIQYFRNAGPGSPGRKAKGTDPKAAIQKSVKPKVLAFVSQPSQGGRKTYSPANFDFDQIDRAVATDTYIYQGLMRYRETMWKEGYDFKSANPDALNYIKQRVKVLGLAQGESFDRFLQRASDDLVKYHNCFIYKMRNADVASMAGLSIKGMDGKDPIAGYFLIPAKTMRIAEDEFGNVLGYQQYLTSGGSGKPIEFKPEDIIHVRHMRQSGTQWGVPFLDAALEDIRSFRLIEENMLTIVQSEIYTLLHYRVNGDMPEWTVEDEEIQAAYLSLLDMKENGAIVTKGADTIDILGSEGKSLDVTPYIDHFKERAIVGLGLSPQQLGVESTATGVASSRADVMFYDKVKMYQAVIEDFVVNEIFFDLLIEGGFDPLTAQRTGKPDPMVYFEFREIDVEAQIKRENHLGVLWLQNMIKHDEMRADTGRVVDPDHEGEYHLAMVELPLAEASKALTGPAGGSNPQSPAKGAGPSKDNPANKSGSRGAPKVKAWDDLAYKVEAALLLGDVASADAAVKEFYVNRTGSQWNRHESDLRRLLGSVDESSTDSSGVVLQVRAIFKTLKSRAEAYDGLMEIIDS